MATVQEMISIKCAECNATFETYRIRLLGVDRILSISCPVCRAKKREEVERQEREFAEKQVAERKHNWRTNCGIPIRFQKESFETFEVNSENQKTIYDLCVDYADKFPLVRGVEYQSLGIFSQGWGVGKSHLACSIAHKIIDRWQGGGQNSPVIYTTEPQMFNRIRSTFNRRQETETETEQDVYNHLIKVPLLIIDDIGKEEVADSRFVQRVWFSVVNGRYDNMLPVVITANLSPDAIEKHLGGNRGNEASFDRLYEMLGGKLWELIGKSYRKTKKVK